MVTGPLQGIQVLELAGIGPGPFAAMVLADLGADVVRVDRPGRGDADAGAARDLLARGRRSVIVDLKRSEGVDVVLRLVESSDVLIEGFRPGVVERLGLGPDACLERNPRLVYGRMTGWGQDGPYAPRAGHDINYIALAGALEPIGRAGQPPTPPLNLVGDFGGGGMLLALGIACALVERASSGHGQVIDAAIVDGAALLTTLFHTVPLGPRGTNLLDGGAPHYDVYECADGKYVSIGAVEPEFYVELCRTLELDGPRLGGTTRPRELGRPQGRSRRRLPDPDPAGMVRALRGLRCVFRARAVARRGTAARAQRRARHVHGAPRRRTAKSRAAVQPHPRGARSSPGSAGRSHRRGAGRARLRECRASPAS